MNRRTSGLIDAFLFNVRTGYIVGQPQTSGPGVLENLAAALEQILAGADPNEALRVESSDGRPGDPTLDLLALKIHGSRQRGEKWAVIESKANTWLESQGRKRVSVTRLKQIYSDRSKQIHTREAWAELQELIASPKK